MSDDLLRSAPVPLAYAPRGRRSWFRRARRWWPLGCIAAAVAVAIAYGPMAWRHYKLLRLQEACMKAEIPTDRPLVVRGRELALSTQAAHPKEYVFDGSMNAAARIDPRWIEFATAIGVQTFATNNPGIGAENTATRFLHERFTPSGSRRLVMVDTRGWVLLIEPAGWFHGVGKLEDVGFEVDKETEVELEFIRYHSGKREAGWPDPLDRTKFILPRVSNGIVARWEYQLQDDGRVTARVIDLYAVIAQLEEEDRKNGLSD